MSRELHDAFLLSFPCVLGAVHKPFCSTSSLRLSSLTINQIGEPRWVDGAE